MRVFPERNDSAKAEWGLRGASLLLPNLSSNPPTKLSQPVQLPNLPWSICPGQSALVNLPWSICPGQSALVLAYAFLAIAKHPKGDIP
jgi:hypothetical protein